MGTKEKSSWTSQIGFILAAAGSAVGLGNIWRFPYRAASGGGGLFLVIYVVLAITFGYALLITDIALGRKTGKSPIGAFGDVSVASGRNFRPLGWLAFVIPFLIYGYYVVIGGWVTWYLMEFLTLHVAETATEGTMGFFTNFITHPYAPLFYTILFSAMSMIAVYKGVEDGIEKFSKYVMPLLIMIVVFVSVFALFLKSPDGSRTGLDGLKIYIVPSFKGMTFSGFLNVVMSAAAQLFYSLSIAMGIMITYGSYCKKDINLEKSVFQIEFFDFFVAFLSGVMIIPAVYVFMGHEGLASAGPGLIFVTLPKVFNQMGGAGTLVGILFFFLVLFAALTSSISLLETIVSDTMNTFGSGREKTTLKVSAIEFVISALVCLGYTAFYFEVKLPTGDIGQILDVLDYVTNNFLMPILAFFMCVIFGWVLKPEWISGEIKELGARFRFEKAYAVLMKFIVPAILVVLFMNTNGIFRMLHINF